MRATPRNGKAKRAGKKVPASTPAKRAPARRGLPPAQATLLQRAAQGVVADIMTKDAVTVRPDTSLGTVIQLMLERQISGIPVVDDAGKPVGIISKTDLVRDQYLQMETHEEPGAEVSPRLAGRRGVRYSPGPGYHVESGDARSAADVMTPVAMTISERLPIATAAQMMAGGGIHRMPVVSEQGAVVGIVSALDVVGWVAGLSN